MSWIGPSPPGWNPPALGLRTALVGPLDAGGGGTIVGGPGEEVIFFCDLGFEFDRPPVGLGLVRIGLAVPAEARIVPDAGRIGELAVDELLDSGPPSFSSEMMFLRLDRATSGSAAGACAESWFAELLRPPSALCAPPRPRAPERPPRWLPLRAEPAFDSATVSGWLIVFGESLRGRGLRPVAEAGLLVSLRVGPAVLESGADFDGLMGGLVESVEGADMVDKCGWLL